MRYFKFSYKIHIDSKILFNDNDLKSVKLNEQCIIQKYIPAYVEYSGYFVVMNGDIKYAIYYEETSKTDTFIIFGAHHIYKKVDLSVYNTVFNKIFKQLGYNGPACADFRIDNDSVKIFEINPRFGGSIVKNNRDFENTINEIVKLQNVQL